MVSFCGWCVSQAACFLDLLVVLHLGCWFCILVLVFVVVLWLGFLGFVLLVWVLLLGLILIVCFVLFVELYFCLMVCELFGFYFVFDLACCALICCFCFVFWVWWVVVFGAWFVSGAIVLVTYHCEVFLCGGCCECGWWLLFVGFCFDLLCCLDLLPVVLFCCFSAWCLVGLL